MAPLVALFLLLHILVTGLVDGALASPALLDAFGNPICSVHGGSPDSERPGAPADKSHLPDCCVVGCSLVAGHAVLAGPADVTPVLAVVRAEQEVRLEHTNVRLDKRTPLNPRAPPGRT